MLGQFRTGPLSLGLGLLLALGQIGCGGSDGSGKSTATTPTNSAGQLVPRFATSFRLQPISGKVLVKEVAGAAFTRLSSARLVPTGTLVDTTSGTVRLTAATTSPTHLQTGDFHGGVFSIEQAPTGGGLTDLRLRDRASRGTACPGAAADRLLGLLRGVAVGRFRTVGRFSAATVRGTEFGVRDRCDGTLTVVERGVVTVRDFALGKDVTVRAGQTYLARAG